MNTKYKYCSQNRQRKKQHTFKLILENIQRKKKFHKWILKKIHISWKDVIIKNFQNLNINITNIGKSYTCQALSLQPQFWLICLRFEFKSTSHLYIQRYNSWLMKEIIPPSYCHTHYTTTHMHIHTHMHTHTHTHT